MNRAAAGTWLRRVLILILIGLIAYGAWMLLRPVIPVPADWVSREIYDYTPQADLRLFARDGIQSSYGNLRSYAARLEGGEQVRFEIDPQGRVAGYYLAGAEASEVNYSLEQALASARQFGEQHGISSGWLETEPDIAGLVETVEGFYYFRFVWIQRDSSSGAYLPRSLELQVNAQNGQVDAFSLLDAPVTISAQPTISQDQAVGIAQEWLEKNDIAAQLTGSKLVVARLPLKRERGQRLFWQVEFQSSSTLQGYQPAGAILVDAGDGAILGLIPLN